MIIEKIPTLMIACEVVREGLVDADFFQSPTSSYGLKDIGILPNLPGDSSGTAAEWSHMTAGRI